MRMKVRSVLKTLQVLSLNQVIIAEWLAQGLATGEVPGSNPGKGDNLINF